MKNIGFLHYLQFVLTCDEGDNEAYYYRRDGGSGGKPHEGHSEQGEDILTAKSIGRITL